MKVIQVHTEVIPVSGRQTADWYTGYIHTVLYQTDANYYQCMKFGNDKNVPTTEELEAAYNHGKRVPVKRAVELFGSSISEKMDWSDE